MTEPQVRGTDRNEAAERLAGEIMVACGERRPMGDLLLKLREAERDWERRRTVERVREALTDEDEIAHGEAQGAAPLTLACGHPGNDGSGCGRAAGHAGTHNVPAPAPPASAGANPADELRAAYHSMPAGNPAVEKVLDRLPRLYDAIEAVLASNPCKELGEAYVECQRLLIERATSEPRPDHPPSGHTEESGDR